VARGRAVYRGSANVHDTQSWATALQPHLGPGRPNLNDTLAAFGLPTNDARDKMMYRANPRFWATRPLTQQMVQWASADASSVWALFHKQLAASASAPPAVTKRCKDASTERLNLVRALRCRGMPRTCALECSHD
jgi:hypothetical protein